MKHIDNSAQLQQAPHLAPGCSLLFYYSRCPVYEHGKLIFKKLGCQGSKPIFTNH